MDAAIAQGSGKIINLASQAGTVVLDKHLAYRASKGDYFEPNQGACHVSTLSRPRRGVV
jgi:hypothetical protein